MPPCDIAYITLSLIIGNIMILLHLTYSYNYLPIYTFITFYLITFELQIFYMFYMYKGVLISPFCPTRKETSYSDQTRDLFNILSTKLNTLLSLLL